MKNDHLEIRRLLRTVTMLQNEFRRAHFDQELISEIDRIMEHELSDRARYAPLLPLIDALRESTLTPRTELYRDAVRACEQLKDAIVVLDRT